jgi:uncharacterized membrane protein
MNVVIDPIWPWSHVGPYLAAARPATVTTLILIALGFLLLPILLRLRPWGLSQRQILRGSGASLAVLLGLLLINSWGTSPGIGGPLRAFGVLLLLALPAGLAGLMVATYLRMPRTSTRRTAAVLLLRLLALGLVAVAVLRPALGFFEEAAQRTLLLILVDSSRSMTIQDEADHQTRWDMLLRSLRDSVPELDRLNEEQQVDVQFYRFDADVSPFDPNEPGQADGPRTEIGAALHALYEQRDSQRKLRGLLLLSDGANNSTQRIQPREEAERWRKLGCPLHTFACGKETTNEHHSDVGITSMVTAPPLVPLKGKVMVKLFLDAPGFEGTTVRLHVLLNDKEVLASNHRLDLAANNEIDLTCPAPDTPGEVKLTVRVDPPADDLFRHNNQAETFITVTRQGLRVLLVDRWRWEPKFIARALAADPRIDLKAVYLGGERAAGEGDGDLLQLGTQQYDVIILGDVTAKQVQAVNAQSLEAIHKMVEGGAGFLMIGGYASFGNSDWADSPVTPLLPVDLGQRGQVEKSTHIVPTQAGLKDFSYLLRLDEGERPAAAWESLPELEGYTQLALRPDDKGSTVLAQSSDGKPLFVTRLYGQGRTLAFAGDTTYRWIVSPKLAAMQSRFWRQVVLWLARQENAGGSVWVKPDTRRLPVRSDLGFSVGVRSKGGVDLDNAEYTVNVVGPDGQKTPVVVTRSPGNDRGVFAKTEAPGVYRIEVHGKATTPEGEVVEDSTAARFIIYDEDIELLRRAAEHGFLQQLATAGGGQGRRIEELPGFLRQMQAQPQLRARTRLDLRPDWSGRKRSPFRIGFFLAFVTVLGCEWLLRRRWDMV